MSHNVCSGTIISSRFDDDVLETHSKHQAKIGTSIFDSYCRPDPHHQGFNPQGTFVVKPTVTYRIRHTVTKVSFIVKGGSGPGNRHSGSLPSLVLGPWET